MATFKPPVRSYNFTDARLIEIGLEKIAFANRDATELATMGVSAPWVTAFNAQLLTFAALPSDETELGEQEEATGEKEVDAGALLDSLKDLRSAAARAFGDKSARYRQFGLKDLDALTDAQLLRNGMVAHGVAIIYATELAAKGYDAADNTALQTLINDYVSGLQNQKIEIGSRDIAQEARVMAGNDIYQLLQNELCEAGKAYWRTRSAAKYNDYLIYNNETGTNPNTITQEGTIAANEVVNISALIGDLPDADDNTVISLFNTSTENDFELIFYSSPSPAAQPVPTDPQVSVGSSESVDRPFTDALFQQPNFNVYNPNPTAGSWKVVVNL